jgi:hypothetical protein
MKKTREVKVPERTVVRPAKTKQITELFCDIGGERIDTSLDNHYGSGGHSCEICGRDICRKESCFVYEDDPDDCNSSIRVCIICHPLRYKKYLLDYYKMLERHDKEIEDFYKMIKKESLDEPIKEQT